ncbi:unnamed protein product [Umbelopsis ramanniana]
MKKNFGKFRQWTGERLGSAKITGQTDDFHQLDQETEQRRVAFDKVYQAAALVLKQLDKKKPSPEDGKTKVSPTEALGACWVNHGSVFPDDSLLGTSLVSLGKTQIEISQLQQDYAYRVKESYIATLEKVHQEYKEYMVLRKKLDSRRLDYDAKQNRLQKAKKEKPEWEQEAQSAKMKYDETEYDVMQRMVYFQECEEDHFNALTEMLDAQLNYHKSSMQLLEGLQQDWGQGYVQRTSEPVRPPLRNTISRSSTTSGTARRNTNMSNNSETDDMYGADESYHQGSPYGTSAPRRPSMRQGSQDNIPSTIRRQPSYSSTGRSEDSYGSQSRFAPPPPMPRSKPSPTKKQVKAIYDFSGENPNELNLCAGDVITVIEEIDQGWWKGELFDANGNRQQGLFPSNYVEEITPPPMPIRPVSSRSQSTSHYSHSAENLEITEESEDSPFADSSRVSASYAHQSPPKPVMARRGTAGSLHSVPTASPTLPRMPSASQMNVRNNIGSSRTPPPPPTSRTPSRSFTTGSHTAPPTPMGRNTTSYFAPSPSNTNQNHPPCDECGCDEFSPDVFKPSRCKSCFHYHG